MDAPPTSLPTVDITPSALLQSTEDIVNRIQNSTANLVDSASPQQVNFDNTIRPLAKIDNDVKSSVQYIALFQAVSLSSELRGASSTAVSIIDKAYLAIFQHEGLFGLVDTVYRSPSCLQVDEEDSRLLDRFHRMFVDNGIQLVGSVRERYSWISRCLIDLRIAFMDNLRNDPGCVWKTKYELEGVSLAGLEIGSDSRYRIPLTRPIIGSILGNCRDANTRAETFLKSQTLYQEKNVPIFREIMILRNEAARLLGFSSFATQKLRSQLVKSPNKVSSLLNEISLALQQLAQQEVRILQQRLDTPLRLSDFDFYHNQMLRKEYYIGQELLAEYFPGEVTVRHMLDIFETLFALAIKELDEIPQNCKWHPDVTVYEAWEANKSVFIGYLDIDIYPRPGKYNHAANFNIYPVQMGSGLLLPQPWYVMFKDLRWPTGPSAASRSDYNIS
ncbi:thimet oligopeptidase, putative [Talaromyces stipitatus ATCC 10500]|uniref:Thimet oligopeptidase, putative n=1 Tax=Talaromyces stipitatus (strain ATCC 10500 / CBS 375.48 / QM 6759 / NRRL 1006) TaxID=441959 RepID=B8MCV3_TALSN|nr:thimet oligopeptidase, putative [Talaromyces stipitatus ATCC 10500]EED17479.1 thimet oligopeptidase, putative [Talaromyces stipitatus ATCC 10500]